MSFLTVEELVELRAKTPGAHIEDFRYGVPPGPLTPVEAAAIIERVREATKANQHSKANRPWSMINLTEKLDPTQPWLGFELECGWADKGSYDRIVDYVVDHLTHVVIDREGNSHYPSEITFSPQNYNDFIDGTAEILRFYDYLGGDGPTMAHPESYCGTHLNISTPSFRKLDATQRQVVASALNYGILATTLTGLVKCFGRQPYGLGHCRSTRQQNWIEFKVFHSRATKPEFEKHLEVSKNMATVMETLSAGYTPEWSKRVSRLVNPSDPYSARNPAQEVILNMEELLLGKETEIQYVNVSPMFTAGLSALSYGSGDRIRAFLQAQKKAA